MQGSADDAYSIDGLLGGADAAEQKICRQDTGMEFLEVPIRNVNFLFYLLTSYSGARQHDTGKSGVFQTANFCGAVVTKRLSYQYNISSSGVLL